MVVYNSYTRSKETVQTFKKKQVLLYVCGITPYDTTHLGHAFTYTMFDVLVRYFLFQGVKVTYVQNVTDIDDDILKKAKEVGKTWKALGNYWTKRFLTDMRLLHILPPTHYVRATDSIPTIIQIITKLLKQENAYVREGNIYFDIRTFKDYGELSKLDKKQMLLLMKERGGDPNDPRKKNPLDFLLWQRSLPGEPSWKTPWGKGRPGWHIECSAMVKQYLGDQIDIHGGGRDLMYPHHESEIAQSETFTGKHPYVRHWMHTAMLLYEGEKMSKSLRNLVMAKDLLKKYSANSIRLLFLRHHYRTPWEYQEAEMKLAKKQMNHAEKLLKGKKSAKLDTRVMKAFSAAMDDDLDTPRVLKHVDALLVRKTVTDEELQAARQILQTLGFIL